MSDVLWVIIWVVPIVFVQLFEKRQSEKRHHDEFSRVCTIAEESHRMLDQSIDRATAEREIWRQERQQLLDRIQAPSFDHLKHHEVKVIKAKSGEKDPIPLEQL